MNCSHAQPTPFFTPEHKNTLLEVPLLGSVLLRKICVCGVERGASLTNLILFRWPLFMFAVSVRCLALRKTLCGHVSIRNRHAKWLFLHFFAKKIMSQRLSVNTTCGSIANTIWYWYGFEENFMGFPTKKTACKSDKNSLQACPMFTCTKTQKNTNRKGAEFRCLLSRPQMCFSALS